LEEFDEVRMVGQIRVLEKDVPGIFGKAQFKF